jgi:hypothetical protein
MTKAHIFPGWLGEVLLPDRTSHHLEQTGYFETFTAKVKSPPPRSRVRQGDGGSRKVRKVCKKCNSGWMGALETPVRPHVVALMNGEDYVLGPTGQTLISTWLAVIATLIDAIDPGQSAIPQSDRDYLRKHRSPPPEWNIWIARYSGNDWHRHRCKRMGIRVVEKSTPGSDDLSCNTQVTTLVVRHLCAHIYSSTAMKLGGYDGISLIRLWPLTGYNITWRNAPRIGDEQIINLAESLGRELPILS